MQRFTDKAIIITGAASGIGRATALRFASEGARLALFDLKGDGVAAVARDIGPAAQPFTCDVADGAALTASMIEAVDWLGGLDVLCNNAGTGLVGTVETISPGEWHRTIAINLDATFYAARVAIPHLRARGGGAIINTASVSGLFGDFGISAYNAAKAGLINLTRSMAMDFAADNIRVNALCPGFIESGAFSTTLEEARVDFADVVPMGRGGQPEEMAGVIAFLASADASYVTGAAIVADGGLTIGTNQPNILKRIERIKAAQG